MPASSVSHVPTGTRPPCVLGLLGFRRPCTNELTDGTTRDERAGVGPARLRGRPCARRSRRLLLRPPLGQAPRRAASAGLNQGRSALRELAVATGDPAGRARPPAK